ncbi:hypothetical protein PvNV_026 [Penaeus vannamei nudivirus]|nr:hypothetical protein PvSNPV_026 [Penaeus vannamei nucleopolyhedrovirus]
MLSFFPQNDAEAICVRRCKDLLDVERNVGNLKSRDYKSYRDIRKLFELCKVHLLTTAEVITRVLHKNNKSNNKKNRLKRKRRNIDTTTTDFFDEDYDDEDDDNFSFDVSISEESRTTRRNAHYKSTVLTVLYYIIYYAYSGTPPDNIGYQYIVQNSKAQSYLNENPKLRDYLYTREEFKKFQKPEVINAKTVNKIKVGDEFLPIQHFNNFKQYTYNYNLTLLVDKCMDELISFAYDQFNLYCNRYIAITLVIKYKDKVRYEGVKKAKRQPVTFEDLKRKDEDGDEDEDYEIDESQNDFFGEQDLYSFQDEFLVNAICEMDNQQKSIQKIHKDTPIVGEFLKYNIETLKQKLKKPSVLLKFYQAWLFECDWEKLFTFLERKINTTFYYATMPKLLLYLIWNMIKLVCISPHRNAHNKNLSTLLQQYRYKEVIAQLRKWTNNYKYSIYTLTSQTLKSNIEPQDIKNFKDLARNTKHIYYHMVSYQAILYIKDVSLPKLSLNLKIVEYTTENHFTKTIFDLLSVVNTKTNQSVDFSTTSWHTRLEMLKDIYTRADQTNLLSSIAEVYLTNMRQIQFDNILGTGNCSAIYFYIRTCGLGPGTIFYKTRNRKLRHANYNASRRFRKVKVEDLRPTIVSQYEVEEPPEIHHQTKVAAIVSSMITPAAPSGPIDYILPPDSPNSQALSGRDVIDYILNFVKQYDSSNASPPHQLSYQQQQQQQQAPINNHLYTPHPLGSISPTLPSPEHTNECFGSINYTTEGGLQFVTCDQDDII